MTVDTSRLYPELTAAGGLTNALRNTLADAGSPLAVSGLNPADNFVAYARVKSGPRFSQVYIAAEERLFLFDFWNRGVMLARGETPDLTEPSKWLCEKTA
jgi:hypothetical protein